MKKELKNRKTNSSRDVKLLAYCAMAGGAFVAAQPANAAVVYSGVQNKLLTDNGSVALDLDDGGVVDFEFRNDLGSQRTYSGKTCNSQGCFSSWYQRYDANLLQLGKHPENAIGGFRNLFAPNRAPSQGQTPGGSYLSHIGSFNLAAGTPIPNNNNLLWFWLDGYNNMTKEVAQKRSLLKSMDSFAFPLSFGRFRSGPVMSGSGSALRRELIAPAWATANIYGTFANEPAGFLGVKFDILGNTHYGWVRYQGTDEDNATTPTVLTGTIIDWAYEAEPDTPIYAGDRGVCQDSDGDGYGLYCSTGPDCDDNNAKVHDNCTCIDDDGDGYGKGPGCKAADCDDTDNATFENCPTCTVKFLPAKLNKFISMLSPLSGIVIRGDEDAAFTKTTKINWGTKNISTVLQVRLSKKIIFSLVVINNAALEAGDSYNVRVGDCAGDLEVR